jgi:hypothetical protein
MRGGYLRFTLAKLITLPQGVACRSGQRCGVHVWISKTGRYSPTNCGDRFLLGPEAALWAFMFCTEHGIFSAFAH